MLQCTNNLRQRNENVEECIKTKEKFLGGFYNEMKRIYGENNVRGLII
jgi:hypothetical protein